ncbi:uncharacterized protein LOC118092825 isoform X2 [Zootoca vivipara]|uniref:uncharacterized protein LOC118092825 isoform X2 n=1 Tax=Zootoca vivipara TaxID=8524 RepID=UPI001590589E|nr:uncharacterized protein LOC118092825 isoform X2 [Zootoca vivipara]
MGPGLLLAFLFCVCFLLHEVDSLSLTENPKKQKEEQMLRINEVNADNPGIDTLEYVELYHTSGQQTPLDGYSLVFYNGKGNMAYKVQDLGGFSTNNQGFFLMGSSTVIPKPSVILPNNTIQNGPDAIALYFGAKKLHEGMTVTNKGLVDALVHKSKMSDRADELVRVLTPGVEPFLEDPFFRTTDESLERCQGTDSHWFFQAGAPTPAMDNHCIPFSQLNKSDMLINEVNVVSSPGEFEFVELQGRPSTQVDGLVLVLIEGSTQEIYFVMEVHGKTSPDGLLLLGPGQFNSSVDLPFPQNSGRPLLRAGANAVALYRGTPANFALGAAVSATDLLDALVYSTAESAHLKLQDVLTPGKPPFHARERSQENDTSVNRCVCCSVTRDPSVYALGKPTPGQFNDCPKRRFGQTISFCIQIADCQEESLDKSEVQMFLSQALDKRCNCGVSPAYFKDSAVACQGPQLVFTAFLTARSTEQLSSLLKAFSLLIESKEGLHFGKWNGTAVKACLRDTNMTDGSPALPKPPMEPLVTETTATSVTLTWDSGNADPISYYVIQYKSKSLEGPFREADGVATTRYSIGGLSPFSEYEFRIIAVNNVGRSPPSELVDARTGEQAPSSPPLKVKARMLSPSTMVVQWEDPEEPNGMIRGFRVYYTIDPQQPLSKWQKHNTDDTLLTTVGGLITGATYSIRVLAFTSVGDGPPSDVIQMKALQGGMSFLVPSQPADFQAEAESDTRIMLTWQPAPRERVTKYELVYWEETDGIQHKVDFNQTSSYALEGLKPDTLYKFQLAARSALGLGAYTPVLEARTAQHMVVPERTTKATPLTELLINEVNSDNPGGREDTEYIELFYPGEASVALQGYWLVLYNGKNNLAYKVINLTGYSTDERGYFLVGSTGVTPKPQIVLPDNTIQNGLDAVALYRSNPNATYKINMPLTNVGLVDALVYKARGSDNADKLLAVLAPGQRVLLEDDSHSSQDESLSRCYSLRPRDHSSFQVTETTPSKENTCPPPGSNSTEETPQNHSVVINELGMANHTILYRFIELKGNPGVSLKGYTLMFFSGHNAIPYSTIHLQGTFGSNGLFLILPEGQTNTIKAHEQRVMPSVWTNPSLQQVTHSVALSRHALNGTAEEHLKDVAVYTWETGASQTHPRLSELIHFVSREGDRPLSLSRCPSCDKIYAVSDPTPGSENHCPQESLFLNLEICLLTPNCSMWPQNPQTLASLQQALVRSMEESCFCGISQCYLHGVTFTCLNSTLKVSGQVWARSPAQRQRLVQWHSHFSSSPHPFAVDGKPLKANAGCASLGKTPQRPEASFQAWEIALIVVGSIFLLLLLAGTAFYCIKRRPQNYTTIELNDRCEFMADF